ncbi:MAG TPA: DUF481 domain-containing protein [Alphaproteobacteria bacterium]|nr:DUF481 domain-containing protein [Alphaproteobacteria bacterium]
MCVSKLALRAAVALVGAALPILSVRHAAEADVMMLANGDRLSGRVLEADDDVVRFASTYGPVLEVPRSEVTRLVRADAEPDPPLPPAPDEPVRTEAAPAADVGGRLTVGATAVADGQRTIQADGELTLDWGKRRLRIAGTVEEAVNGSERSLDRQRLELRYDNDISETWYSAAQGIFDRDGFRDLRRRFTASASLGRYVIDRPGRRLSIEGGPAIVTETFSDDRTEWSPVARFAYRFSQDLFDARTAVDLEQEALVAVDSFQDLLLRSRAALRHALTEELEARAELRHEYDTDVAPGQDPHDLTYILGVGYTF